VDGIGRETLFENLPVEDVWLPSAPLVRVIGQLRFGKLAVMGGGDDAAQKFIRSMASTYPFLEEGVERTVLFAPGEPIQQHDVGKTWRLRSENGQSLLALTNGALTLETAAYQRRAEFCAELGRVAEAFQEATRVPAYDRVAVRYTNRIVGDEMLGKLPQLVQQQFLGLGAAPSSGVNVVYFMSQVLMSYPDSAHLLAQFGILPENGTFDPTLPAAPQRSWVLDLDSYQEFPDGRQRLPADVDTIVKAATDCATRAYGVFRWAVSDGFLEHFGGRS
jgi:uncharacterized protein (TIGR04255 family)